MIAALPAALSDADRDWSAAAWSPTSRFEWAVGSEFINRNGEKALVLHRCGRLMCLVFPICGGPLCLWWGWTLHRERVGWIAWGLWVVSPTVLTWGGSFSPDAGAATMILAANAAVLGALRRATAASATLAGLVAGLALLTKFTAILLVPCWLLVWILHGCIAASAGNRSSVSVGEAGVSHDGATNFREPPGHAAAPVRLPAHLVGLAAIVALVVVNVGYSFDRTSQPLGEFEFASFALTGQADDRDAYRHPAGNRFRGTLAGSLPVPLPAELVYGIDTQKIDFENGMGSYLLGEWKPAGGWWYYYLVCAAVKT